jgi:hypothetical protein
MKTFNSLRRGDVVITTGDFYEPGFLWNTLNVPKGTNGVITQVNTGWFNNTYDVSFENGKVIPAIEDGIVGVNLEWDLL